MQCSNSNGWAVLKVILLFLIFLFSAKRGENFEILLCAKRGENFEILLRAKRGENFEILLRAKR